MLSQRSGRGSKLELVCDVLHICVITSVIDNENR